MPALQSVVRRLTADAGDADLLRRYADRRDPDAFAVLVRRHGPMVLGICRRVIGDAHLAEDAFQGTFLVLARRAGCIGRPAALAGWLYGVAFRIARRARGRAARPAPRPRNSPASTPAPLDLLTAREVTAVLEEELAALPEAYRLPLALCCLDGMSLEEAARRLRWRLGSVKGRLERGRARLRKRLERRGLHLGVAFGAALVVGTARAVPISLLQTTVGQVAGAALPGPAALADGLLRAARLGRLRLAAVALVAGALGLGGLLAPAGPPAADVPPKKDEPSAPQPRAPAATADADLPDGAVVRLGSTALSHPDTLTHLRFSADGAHLLSYGHGKVRRWDAKTGAAVRRPAADITTTFGTTLLSPDAAKVIAPHVQYDPRRFSVREYDLATGGHTELFVIPPRTDPDGKDAGSGMQRFALSPDGTLLVEGWRHEAYVWDLKARAVRHRLRLPGTANAHFLFTPDGKHLVTAEGDDRAVRFWDVGTGKDVRVLTRDARLRSGVGGLAVSADGRWVAAVDNSHLLGTGTEMAVWDLANPGPPRVITLVDGFGSGALAFGPRGVLYVVSVPPEKGTAPVVTKWDVVAGKRLARWAGPHLGRYGPATAAVSPGGDTLAVGSYWGVIRLYDTRTGAEVVPPPALSSEVIGVTFDLAGGEIRTAAADGSAAAWDAATGKSRTRRDSPVPLPPAGDLVSVVPSPDGQWVLTYGLNPDGPVPPWRAVLWDAATGGRKHIWDMGGRVKELIPVPGGKLLAALVEARGGYQAQVWDIRTGEEVPGIYPLLHPARTRCAVFADGKTFLVMDEERATGYDLATGKPRFSWKVAEHDVLGRPLPAEDRRPGLVRAVAASPDGKLLAIAVGGDAFVDKSKRTDNLALVEAETGRLIRRASTPETSGGWLVFSPDGRRVAGPRCVWDVATLKEVRRFPARPEVTAAGFSPDGKRVATGHANGAALVWAVSGAVVAPDPRRR